MATVHEEILVHPTQASRVRLRVFDRPPEPTVAGMGPDQPGFLVTEERIGARTVSAIHIDHLYADIGVPSSEIKSSLGTRSTYCQTRCQRSPTMPNSTPPGLTEESTGAMASE